MLTYLLSIAQYEGLTLYEFFIGFVLVNWGVRFYFSRKHKPYVEDFDISAAVLIPVLDEEITIFESVLKKVKAAKPDEFLVVINGSRNVEIEKACQRNGIDFEWIEVQGKRHAIEYGLKKLKSELVVLVDSDTYWEDSTLVELKKPFIDPKVGGATTRQTIRNENDNIWTRWAAWIEEIRNEYSFPAMGSQETVGCLPGRTIAFRKKILDDCMEEFMTDEFLGVHLEVSDDRALTNYTLKAGYKTVFQSTSRVETEAPTIYGKLVRQQLRWARGSQYNTLRMMPWMLKNAPLLAFLYASDILIPMILLAVGLVWAIRSVLRVAADFSVWFLPMQTLSVMLGSVTLAALSLVAIAVIFAVLFSASRYLRVLKKDAKQVLFLPVIILINFFVLVPLRILGFWWMAYKSEWGTREGYEATKDHAPYNWLKHIPQVAMLAFIGTLVAISIGV